MKCNVVQKYVKILNFVSLVTLGDFSSETLYLFLSFTGYKKNRL